MSTHASIMSAAEAVARIPHGAVVALGGQDGDGPPMALVREIARRRLRDLHLIGVAPGIEMDLLVAAGCVAVIETASKTSDGAIGRAVAAKALRLIQHAPELLAARLLGGALELPFMVQAAPETTHAPMDPEIVRPLPDPFEGAGARLAAVRSIRPDIAVLHAHSADHAGAVSLGPGQQEGPLGDKGLARASRGVIVSVEQVVSTAALDARPRDSILRHANILAVVELPYGAHPCGFAPLYDADAPALQAYRESAREPAAPAGWLDAFADPVGDHWTYLDRVGARGILSLVRHRSRLL